MTGAAGDIIDQAIAWHLRLADATAEDWHAFVAWLEADAEHQAAYDRVTMGDALLDLTPRTLVAANDAYPPRRFMRWAAAGGGAIAAALVALALAPQQAAPSLYTIETAPGATRTVALDEGTSIEMNGGTRLTLRKGDPRYAVLDAGEATFHVRHDAAHPFELHSGDAVIRDLGTVFNVARDGHRLGVQVAEGSVLYDPARSKVTLKPGMALAVDESRQHATLETVPAETVGSWRVGTVNFHNASASSVATALERSTGATVRVDPSLADRPFTGTVHLTGARDRVIPRVAGLLNASWRREGGAWVLFAKGDGGR